MTEMNFKLSPDELKVCKILNRTISEITATEQFFAFAKLNQVAAAAGHIIKRKKENLTEIEQKFIDEHEKVKTYLDNYLKELDRVASLLAQNEIKVVALKNAGIARAIFDCTGCCPMGDLDLLVDKQDFLKAHEILVNDNYTFKYRSYLERERIQNALAGGGTEYWKELPTGEKLWMELQFRPVAGRWISYEQEPNATDLINRSVAVPGTHVRILSPEDNLLQVALHTAKHSYIRAPGFRLHTDVDRIVRNQPIDWLKFVEMVMKFRVKKAVYFSLLIPCELLDTPIPKNVLTVLSPGFLVKKIIIGMLSRGGLFNPEEKKFGKLSFIIFNILLYDSIHLLWKNLFPGKKIMMEKYSCKAVMVPIFHIKRIFDLVLRRQKT